VAGSNIWEGIATLVCDLDGVVYLGDEGIVGSGAALRAIEDAGVEVVFATNNSTRTPEQVAAKIAATAGFAADPAAVVGSAQVTAARLAGQVETALVVGGAAISVALGEVGIATTNVWQDAGAVVVGLDTGITYDKLASATLALNNGALFYATNTDSTYPTPQGLLPGGGVMVGALAIASGRQPVVSGKPEPAMARHIASRAAGPFLVVGDRPETDVALAIAAGWASALVLSGVTRRLEEVPFEVAPDIVVGSLADLAGLLPAAR
jgi:HAD superfamily hydrolase (TIGR01450 family)